MFTYSSAELDKYRRLQMEVDRDIARFREEKMRKIHEREKEKKDVSIPCWTSEAKDYFSQGHELLTLYMLNFSEEA